MPVLAIRDVTFGRGGVVVLESLNVTVEAGQRKTDVRRNRFAASVVAQIAAGIVKPTRGKVFISEYDPAIQPVQSKRLVGFVPASLPEQQFGGIERYIAYRAALWSIDCEVAMQRARQALSMLASTEANFAKALAGALISAPPLVVLDQPPENSAAEVFAAIGNAGLFTTHASTEESIAWRA